MQVDMRTVAGQWHWILTDDFDFTIGHITQRRLYVERQIEDRGGPLECGHIVALLALAVIAQPNVANRNRLALLRVGPHGQETGRVRRSVLLVRLHRCK